MSMYKEDRYGEYQVLHSFIEASGGWWSKCEVRRYADGVLRVHQEQEKYLHDNPAKRELHAIYLSAKRGLE